MGLSVLALGIGCGRHDGYGDDWDDCGRRRHHRRHDFCDDDYRRHDGCDDGCDRWDD